MIILDRNSSETARSYAMRVLLYNIIHVELQPGSAVSENELSSALSLSRTPIREALIELNRIGLVEILPQRGSYISKINYAIVEESRFVRLVMETAVIKLACESITDDYLLALKQNIEQQKACQTTKDGDRFLEIDNEFHRLIFECAGKMWSYHFVEEQMVHFDRLRALAAKSGYAKSTIPDHEDILYALKRTFDPISDRKNGNYETISGIFYEIKNRGVSFLSNTPLFYFLSIKFLAHQQYSRYDAV